VKTAAVKTAAVKTAAAKRAAAKPADSTAKPAAGTRPGAATATKPSASVQPASTSAASVQPASASAAAHEPAAAKPGPSATAAAPAAPIPGYDDLSVASLRARLRGLDAAGVRALLDYEKANARRDDVITMFERRLSKIENGAS
jgi:hypothetical protein